MRPLQSRAGDGAYYRLNRTALRTTHDVPRHQVIAATTRPREHPTKPGAGAPVVLPPVSNSGALSTSGNRRASLVVAILIVRVPNASIFLRSATGHSRSRTMVAPPDGAHGRALLRTNRLPSRPSSASRISRAAGDALEVEMAEAWCSRATECGSSAQGPCLMPEAGVMSSGWVAGPKTPEGIMTLRWQASNSTDQTGPPALFWGWPPIVAATSCFHTRVTAASPGSIRRRPTPAARRRTA